MTPLRAGLASSLPKTGRSLPGIVKPVFFGSSSRYWGRPSRRDHDEDDDEDEDDRDERLRESGTYRTLCVRLCDGYYFPISFSATRDRFDHDARTCANSCSQEARLFVYRNPGANVEDMVDLQGRPYQELRTAFRYRTEYVAACRCKPNPWDAEALDRHRLYAAAAAKRKAGGRDATTSDAGARNGNRGRAPVADADAARPADTSRRSGEVDDRAARMGLGARTLPKSRNRASGGWNSEPEWRRRIFSVSP